MKTTIKLSVLLSIMLVLNSCLGDKKAVEVPEINDTSFVNKNFKGNRIQYAPEMSACDNISRTEIAALYNVSEDKVEILDIAKSDRRDANAPPSCQFFIKQGDNDFLWLRGSMFMEREVLKGEVNYDNAKLTGTGEEFEEAWALQKSISKSSEWLDGMGLAALWNEKNKELKIKFDGYTLHVYPIKNRMNENEIAKNRDYKKAAIAMAKAAGYIN